MGLRGKAISELQMEGKVRKFTKKEEELIRQRSKEIHKEKKSATTYGDPMVIMHE